ncbi:MAG: methylmalonyl Co-A mutase-associated GTPase MeaB [Pseudomonadota bacterium]
MSRIDIKALEKGVLAGDRRALAKAITLIESARADHRAQAQDLLARLMPHGGKAIRLGLSGAPGVGKSTFIEAFGGFLIAKGHRLAVLAVDPSSARSGGSILGDKTRMERLARAPAAFIRPSPSGGGLGGVARRTREALLASEAAGFDVVIVETVGVGQSETMVADMVDMFLLLIAPGGGDELQGIKRGIMELADLVIVNKADGDMEKAARRAQADYRAALSLIRPKYPDWRPRALLASALEGHGLEAIWREIGAFCAQLKTNGALERLRARQAVAWMWAEIEEGLKTAFQNHPRIGEVLKANEAAVAAGDLPPAKAAQHLLALFAKP